MTKKYTISDVRIPELSDGSSLIRNVTLNVGGRSLDHFSKCTERTTDLGTLNRINDKKILNECYIDLTLGKLRELDSDRDAQDRYISSRARFLDRELINVLMIKLRIGAEEHIEEQDLEYLNALLTWGRNDIYVMPLLEFDDKVDRVERVEIYNNFVRRMLEMRGNWVNQSVNIGMSIPKLYPRRLIKDLFALYDDENPTFVAVDFNNARMDKPSDITSTVIKHFRDENEEKIFLYGVNVKPYKKSIENREAWDIYTVNGSFNAIGPTHSKPRAMTLPSDWINLGRVFDETDIVYTSMEGIQKERFIDWLQENYSIEAGEDASRMYPYLRRYNFQGANDVLYRCSEAIRQNDIDYISEILDARPEELKGINLMATPRGRRRTL